MDIRVGIDTSRLTDLFRGDHALAQQLGHSEEVLAPLIVLLQFLARPTVSVVCPDLTTAEQYVLLFGQLKQAGTPIPTSALWIAALALQHHAALITWEQRFDAIPQLLQA